MQADTDSASVVVWAEAVGVYMTDLIQFKSAIDALAFSEEVLSKAKSEGFFSRLLRGPKGHGSLTWEELRDQALAISVMVDRIEPRIHGYLLCSIYGREDRRKEREVWDWLVSAISGLDGMKHREPQLLLKLVFTVFRGHRRFVLTNKPLRMSTIASAIGVRRQNMKEGGWCEAVAILRGTIHNGMVDGERSLEELLRDKGLM